MQKNVFGIGILGTGLIAKFHARAVGDTPCARLVAVCSRDQVRADSFAAEFGCAAFVSLDAMLAHPEIDILLIATPSGAHLEPAVKAARMGKHVLCEKPLEITVERVDAMITAHREAGTKLGCIFQCRYIRAVQAIRSALREGRFGTLTYGGIYVPWWRTDEYYYASPWHGTKEFDGGGALMNQSIHMIDLLCDIMPPITSVAACVSSVGHPKIEVEDAATVSLQFKGGAVGVIYGSTSSFPGRPKRMELSGTDGTAILEDETLSVFEFRNKRPGDADLSNLHSDGTNTLAGAANPAAMTHGLHTECVKQFIRSLQNGETFQISGESARKAVAVIQAIYLSAEIGRRVPVAYEIKLTPQ